MRREAPASCNVARDTPGAEKDCVSVTSFSIGSAGASSDAVALAVSCDGSPAGALLSPVLLTTPASFAPLPLQLLVLLAVLV